MLQPSTFAVRGVRCHALLYLSHVLFFTLSQNTANRRMHDVAFYVFLGYGLDLVEADDC